MNVVSPSALAGSEKIDLSGTSNVARVLLKALSAQFFAQPDFALRLENPVVNVKLTINGIALPAVKLLENLFTDLREEAMAASSQFLRVALKPQNAAPAIEAPSTQSTATLVEADSVVDLNDPKVKHLIATWAGQEPVVAGKGREPAQQNHRVFNFPAPPAVIVESPIEADRQALAAARMRICDLERTLGEVKTPVSEEFDGGSTDVLPQAQTEEGLSLEHTQYLLWLLKTARSFIPSGEKQLLRYIDDAVRAGAQGLPDQLARRA